MLHPSPMQARRTPTRPTRPAPASDQVPGSPAARSGRQRQRKRASGLVKDCKYLFPKISCKFSIASRVRIFSWSCVLPGWRAASRRGGGGPSRVSSGATPPQERWGGGWRGEAAGRALGSRRRGRVALVSRATFLHSLVDLLRRLLDACQSAGRVAVASCSARRNDATPGAPGSRPTPLHSSRPRSSRAAETLAACCYLCRGLDSCGELHSVGDWTSCGLLLCAFV